MNSNRAVCFTGHRPSKFGTYDESVPLIVGIKQELALKIYDLIQSGYNEFISGMAIGVDTWAAEAVIDARRTFPNEDIKLICAIPFEGQESRWPQMSKERYTGILDEADEIHIVCEGGYHPYKMQKRNEWMVDNSKVVIGVWDGSTGGTANCVKYAKKKKSPLVRINPNDITK